MPKRDRRLKNDTNSTRPLVLREQGQEYAKVTKLLGNCMVECSCYDNKVRIGTIRNKLRRGKSNRIGLDTIVLVSLRSFQDDKVDVFHVYNNDEVRELKKLFEIPEEVDSTRLHDVVEFETITEEVDTEIDIDAI